MFGIARKLNMLYENDSVIRYVMVHSVLNIKRAAHEVLGVDEGTKLLSKAINLLRQLD